MKHDLWAGKKESPLRMICQLSPKLVSCRYLTCNEGRQFLLYSVLCLQKMEFLLSGHRLILKLNCVSPMHPEIKQNIIENNH